MSNEYKQKSEWRKCLPISFSATAAKGTAVAEIPLKIGGIRFARGIGSGIGVLKWLYCRYSCQTRSYE